MDERDILKVLMGAQNQVPDHHRPVLAREVLDSVAERLRRDIAPACDMVALAEISNVLKVVVKPGPAGSCGGEWTDGERHVLYSARIAEPMRSFRRLHGLMHVVLKRFGEPHTEGDVNLCALRVALPPYLYDCYSWTHLCYLCELVPYRLVLGWGVHLWSRKQLELPFSTNEDVDKAFLAYDPSEGTFTLTTKRSQPSYKNAILDRLTEEMESGKPPSDLTRQAG